MRSRFALIATAAALAGCGGDDEDGRRDAVALYVRDANTTLQRSAVAFAEAERALRAFSLEGKAAAASQRDLTEAAADLRAARADLAEIEPPVEARKLHADMLELVEVQGELARDLAELAGHLPRAAEVLADAEAARARLQRALEQAQTGATQADAARAYAAESGRTLDRLRSLDPPEVLEGWHAGQLEVLRTSQTLARRLADALAAGDEERIRSVVAEFDQLSQTATSAARAQVLAVRDFNERVEAQRDLVRAIESEQRRLDRELR